jgi:hypothetical protein
VVPSYFQRDTAPDRRGFLEAAKTIYHEARHCEQWYHMARYASLGGSKVTPDTVANDTGVPAAVAVQAFGRKMMGGDPMLTLTKGWYDSVYKRSGREIDLQAVGLKSTGNSLLSDFHRRVHKRYANHLPEEKDAWDCERLLDTAYTWP